MVSSFTNKYNFFVYDICTSAMAYHVQCFIPPLMTKSLDAMRTTEQKLTQEFEKHLPPGQDRRGVSINYSPSLQAPYAAQTTPTFTAASAYASRSCKSRDIP
jgi:hypothetical protein